MKSIEWCIRPTSIMNERTRYFGTSRISPHCDAAPCAFNCAMVCSAHTRPVSPPATTVIASGAIFIV